MSSKLYDINKFGIDQQALTFLMIDTLFICLEYRNLAAHGGRIYNYTCSSRLRFIDSDNNGVHGFSQLLFLLHILNYQTPYEHLNQALTQQLNRHCNQYPEDITYLGQILNINIAQRETVWLSPNSNKYHRDEYCSGMKKSIEISYEDAVTRGLSPCKKCC